MIAQTPTQTYTDLIYVIPSCFLFPFFFTLSAKLLSVFQGLLDPSIGSWRPGQKARCRRGNTTLITQKIHWTAFLGPTIFLFFLPEDTGHSTGDF
jgi:hypothetical protein